MHGLLIIIELVELVTPAIIPFIENSNAIVDFATHFKSVVGAILTGQFEGKEIKAQELKDVAQILSPIVNDSASQFNLSTNVQGDLSLHLHIDSIDSNIVQSIINKRIKQLSTPEVSDAIEHKVILTLYQARSDIRSTAGNKGIIEDLSPKPLNIIFEKEEDKEAMLHGENPFTTAFVVDIKMMYANHKVVAYKIMALHEQFEIA